MIWRATFWRDVAERAIRAAAAAALSAAGTDGLGLVDGGALQVLVAGAIGGLVSVLFSLSSTNVGDADTASFLTTSSTGRHAA